MLSSSIFHRFVHFVLIMNFSFWKFIRERYCTKEFLLIRWNNFHPDTEETICTYGWGWRHGKTLRCPSGEVLLVTKGFFGRKDRTTCNRGPIYSTTCAAGVIPTTDLLKQRCDNRQTCKVNGDIGVRPDPCYGTAKYYVVQYVCGEYDLLP